MHLREKNGNCLVTGLIIGGVLLVAVVGLVIWGFFYVRDNLEGIVSDYISEATDYAVELGDADISLTQQRFVLSDLRVEHPHEPEIGTLLVVPQVVLDFDESANQGSGQPTVMDELRLELAEMTLILDESGLAHFSDKAEPESVTEAIPAAEEEADGVRVQTDLDVVDVSNGLIIQRLVLEIGRLRLIPREGIGQPTMTFEASGLEPIRNGSASPAEVLVDFQFEAEDLRGLDDWQAVREALIARLQERGFEEALTLAWPEALGAPPAWENVIRREWSSIVEEFAQAVEDI